MMQIIDNMALLLDRQAAPKIIPNIKKSAKVDEGVLVKWGFKESSTLADLGFNPPSPILREYSWSGKLTPFDHQKTTASFLSIRRRAFCFSEQGTGKTASVIWAADYLMKRGAVKRVLVLCPLSIMQSAWQQDLFKFAMHRSCVVAHGTHKQRQKAIHSGADFVVINYDGVEIVKEDIVAGDFDLIVIDEANAYKNPQTKRWKTLKKIMLATDPRVWMLTGTPAAQSPVDAYGLAKLMEVPHCPKFFTAFRDSVMYQATRFKWLPKPSAKDTVHRLLQPAIRFEKKDCLDLPSVTFTERVAPLTPQQQKYYELLKSQMLFAADGEEVSAVNAAAKINKLLQISGGAVYTDTGEVLEFDIKNRLSVVLEAIEETDNKVLVFIPFTHTIGMLKDKLDARGIPCEIINGKVPASKRGDIVNRFQQNENPKVLLIQPQAASHGLTLTAADTIIWYAPVTSVETYLQANARIDRPGQKNAMTIVHVKGSPVEDRLYKMLQGKVDDHTQLIDLYKEIFCEG
jgi:SNF2 family DNA or RNA helicase